jgi:CBS domain-containing protein
MDVRELMSRNIVTVPAAATCLYAVGLMATHKIRHLPVVDLDGTLCGIVTDRDLRHHLFEPRVFGAIGETPAATLLGSVPVSAVMSCPVVTVTPDAPLEEAARVMLEGKVGSLPVVEHGRVVGILTETDLLRRIVGEDLRSGEALDIIISFP